MSEGLQTLSEREKETLRLLLDGHDAKSIARSMGLSVHTVDERLRDARRKLGVSSSREAARVRWVLLLDKQRWEESWDAAGTLLKSQMPKTQWASTIQPVRQPLGAMSARTVLSATKASSIPGAPAGDYEIVVFKTNFARKPDAIETVVLAREGARWKVNGYFIR